jgi:tetratricopeptide (TPR) repeat protein
MAAHKGHAGLVAYFERLPAQNSMDFRSGFVVRARHQSRLHVWHRLSMTAGWFAICLTSILGTVHFLVVPLRAQTAHSPDPSRSPTEQFENAIAHDQKILAGSPTPTIEVETRTRLAMTYFMLHRYSESLEAIQPLTGTGKIPKAASTLDIPAQAWTVQGLDYLELNRLAEAIKSLQRALAINPSAGTARLALGDALARSGRLQEASKQYERQTSLTPSVADAWYKLGLAYSEIASKLSNTGGPAAGSTVAQQLSAEEMLAKGENLEAARVLARLVRQAPQQIQVHADLGLALLGIGYTKSAEEHFRKELAFDPECPLAQFGMAQLAMLRGDWAGAAPLLANLAGSHPHELTHFLELPPAGNLRQAWTEGKIPMFSEFANSQLGTALKMWLNDSGSTVVSVHPSRPRVKCTEIQSTAMQTLGVWLSEPCYLVLVSDAKTRKALSGPQTTKLAEAEFRLGRYEAARRDAERALSTYGRNDWATYWLSKSNAALAEECFVKVGTLSPDSARVHQMLAQHYVSWSDYSKAKPEYMAAIRLAPDLPDLHLGLGSVYWRTGEWPQAEKELKQTLELTPSSAAAHYELGDIYLQQRRWQAAIAELQQVPADSSLGQNARLGCAKAKAEVGQTREALEDLLTLLDRDPSGEVHYRIAGLYRKLGDPAKAQEALAAFKRLKASTLQANQDELPGVEFKQNPAVEDDSFDHP